MKSLSFEQEKCTKELHSYAFNLKLGIKTFFEEFIEYMRDIKENTRIIEDEEVFIKNVLGFFARKDIIS